MSTSGKRPKHALPTGEREGSGGAEAAALGLRQVAEQPLGVLAAAASTVGQGVGKEVVPEDYITLLRGR